jgi:sigma-B regulation protein RsbU (phosphoserine phosphatase)
VGDVLLLYTDGVIETRRGGEFFGQEHLETLVKRERVSVKRLPQLILDRLLVSSEGKLTDDVAILAVSLTNEPRTRKSGWPNNVFTEEQPLG